MILEVTMMPPQVSAVRRADIRALMIEVSGKNRIRNDFTDSSHYFNDDGLWFVEMWPTEAIAVRVRVEDFPR